MNTASLLREIREELEGLIDDMVRLESQTVNAPKHGDAEGGKEDFEKINTQWKKLYGKVGGSAKLLQEDKRKTKVTFSYGANRKLAEKRISDTDLLIHGLHLFMSDKEGKKISPPVLPDAFSAMMMTNRDILSMQNWLVRHKEKADRTIRACEKMKRRLKELLADKKRLKTENKALLHHAQNLEKELNDLPTAEKIVSMRQEVLELKEKLYVLNQEQIDTLNAKDSIYNSTQMEMVKRTEFIEAMLAKTNNLQDDITELISFGGKLIEESNNLINGQLHTFSDLVNVIWKLKSLMDRMYQILETRSSNLTQMKADVTVQIKCGEEMKLHLIACQNFNKNLIAELDALFENVSGVEKTISEMKRNTTELLTKATSSCNSLLSDFNLEEVRIQKEVEFKKNNIEFVKVTTALNKLESVIKAFEITVPESVRVDSHDYISATWNTNRESLLWEEKVISLLSDSDKLEDMIVEAKEKALQSEKKDMIDNAVAILNKKDPESQFTDGVSYSMSTSVLFNDLTDEHEFKLTGTDTFTKGVTSD